jgi:hypothetical protein
MLNNPSALTEGTVNLSRVGKPMSNLITSNSPFDSIRHFDSDGNEFWYARELMPLLQYKLWQRFNEVIEVAIENLETVVSSSVEHFLSLEIKTKGRPKLDYKLSRLACYHIALCCDSRGNDAVKMAKHYFAVKTREAEVIIPAQKEALEMANLEMERLRLQNENLRLENENMRMRANYLERRKALSDMYGDQKLLLLDGRPEAIVEVRETVVETIVTKGNSTTDYNGYSTAQIAKELGFKSGRELEDWLRAVGQDHLIKAGKRVVPASYIPLENKKKIMQVWADNRYKSRQLIIGE